MWRALFGSPKSLEPSVLHKWWYAAQRIAAELTAPEATNDQSMQESRCFWTPCEYWPTNSRLAPKASTTYSSLVVIRIHPEILILHAWLYSGDLWLLKLMKLIFPRRVIRDVHWGEPEGRGFSNCKGWVKEFKRHSLFIGWKFGL